MTSSSASPAPAADTLPAAALAYVRGDPVLAALIERCEPPALQRTVDPGRLFGHLVDAIVSQQISAKASAAIVRRLEASLPGGVLSVDSVQAAGPEGLRACGVSPQKTRYLLDLAARAGSGELILERLPDLDDEAVITHLIQVKGIGRWTAQMVLIFALARPDVLPVDDLGFRTALRRQYNLAALPTPADIERLAAPWRPYRTYGAWYMWRSLENVPG